MAIVPPDTERTIICSIDSSTWLLEADERRLVNVRDADSMHVALYPIQYGLCACGAISETTAMGNR
eukprot:CCRYP_017645-RB/>CCRYP_017645-RB protein AED:0.48 eAED:0.84 QI:0/0/0/1/0/0/2/0/65